MRTAIRILAVVAVMALIPLGGAAAADNCVVNDGLCLDHYKCYDVVGEPLKDTTVSLVDQFQEVDQKVLKPRFLCNPVDKNDEGIINPIGHLVCYGIQVNRSVEEEVFVVNQFGEHSLRVKKDHMLCVPSLKFREPVN